MKLFLTWSGDKSKRIASALRDWIPSIINDVEPWMSEEDIAKGAHWPSHLGRELEQAKFGIICVTPDNLNEPWILFEAGALSRVIEQARVCPYLFGVEKSAVRPPLGHFQASKSDKEDTKKLLESINGAVEDAKGIALTEIRLTRAFEKFWPDLEQELAKVSTSTEVAPSKRSIDDVAIEILDTVRGLARDLPASVEDLRTMVEIIARTAPIFPARTPGTILGSSGGPRPFDLSSMSDKVSTEKEPEKKRRTFDELLQARFEQSLRDLEKLVKPGRKARRHPTDEKK
jgi:hypothetical protein